MGGGKSLDFKANICFAMEAAPALPSLPPTNSKYLRLLHMGMIARGNSNVIHGGRRGRAGPRVPTGAAEGMAGMH